MGIRSSANLPIDAFTIPIWMVQNHSIVSPITLYPRWRDSTADTFAFSSAGDYTPAAAAGGNAYVDISFTSYPGISPWYSDVYDSLVGRRSGTGNSLNDVTRTSLWVNMDVGDAPHPSPSDYASTRLAILINQAGAYHSLITTNSPTPNYSEPRLLCDSTAFQNFRVSGQNYSGNYHSWRCLFHYQPWQSNGVQHIRLINLGGKPDSQSLIVIRAMVLLMHGRTGVSGA